jgi:hypothetical protein
MTIMAEPHQIFYTIVHSILVDVMDEEYAKIFYATMVAYCRGTTSLHNVPVCVLTVFPTWMIFSDDHILVFPNRQTGFVAEEGLAFGMFEMLRRAIDRFPARSTFYICSILLCLELARSRAELSPAHF